jgi:uncharacterized protein (UPF0210 family)
MKIRSVTGFVNPGWPLNKAALDSVSGVVAEARAALEAAGYEAQTTRLATIPFPKILERLEEGAAVELARTLEEAATQRGFGYVSLGPALPKAQESFGLIPLMLAATENTFFGGAMTSAGGSVSTGAMRACAEVIHAAAGMDPNGFTNLRFAALANVPPGSPFFPAAYHRGDEISFALATQAADLAVDAFTGAKTVDEGAQRLTQAIQEHGGQLAGLMAGVAKKHKTVFGGIDFSLAPFPEEAESLGTAFERMGVPRVGLHGSLAAAAILTQAIERAEFPRAGFNGLLMPPLEDATLAKRAAEGVLTVNDLLIYSAVCGTGLDTIPLPGDSSVEQLAAVLLDVAALALRLDKPLTARLMPIPGAQAGDETHFEFDYFANSRVMSLKAEGLSGALGGSQAIPLKNRA